MTGYDTETNKTSNETYPVSNWKLFYNGSSLRDIELLTVSSLPSSRSAGTANEATNNLQKSHLIK